ncbi:MAG: NAD-dependent deacylase [Nitrospinae bacterium]|nr:NAD-dependent deacylase [Nitrospinota bacterium]
MTLNISPGDLRRMKQARRAAALTGAGVSAESGVPTFRGKDGLWRSFRAEDLATPEAFARDPKLVWEWYDWRRSLIAPLAPNPGHYALAQMEKIFPRFTLITQNVDGLHRAAGSTAPVEMHGNIWLTRCVREGSICENRQAPLPEIPPRCPGCGALLRPHIVWFGESLDPDVLEQAFTAAREAELFFVIGTAAAVQPAASLVGIAKEHGAMVVEVNVEETPVTHLADVSLRGPSGKILPELVNLLQSA